MFRGEYDSTSDGVPSLHGLEAHATKDEYNHYMPMTCNIDAKGKRVRLIYGIVLVVAGIVLLFVWALPSGGILAWVVTVALLAGGMFSIFEARAGWCAVRAMGFKTPV
jgi:hypothetical protein